MARSATDEKVDRSIIENRAPSVGHMFRERVQALPQGEAFLHPVGDGWESLTWSSRKVRRRPGTEIVVASSVVLRWSATIFLG